MTFLGVYKDGVGGVDGLDGVWSVTVSPDGAYVYAASWYDNAVAAFSRDGTTGALAFLEAQVDGVGGVDGLRVAHSVAVSPGGAYVYAAGWGDSAVSVFSTGLPPAIPVDVKPRSCPNPLNVKSRGKLPVAILGTDAFDVEQINPASVRLEGVAPLRWALEDVATPYEPLVGKEGARDCTTQGPDGYRDLTLKFDTQEIVAAPGEVRDRDVRVLELTGNLKEEFGGTPIVGEDVVVVLKKGKK